MANSEPATAASTDLTGLPSFTFTEVEEYSKRLSGCDSTRKAYKFFAEPGYLHNIKVEYPQGHAKLTARCYRSMKKSEAPHSLAVCINQTTREIKARCSCVAGVGGYCQHSIGLLFYMAHCKQLGLKSLPDELTCTSLPQRWSVPRERKIVNKTIQDVMVKKPKPGADYQKFIKSTLYSPAKMYSLIGYESLSDLDPTPLMSTVVPLSKDLAYLPSVQTRFGAAAQGSVLSYQQKLSQEYVINDFSCTYFPELPIEGSEARFENNISFCLNEAKQATLESLHVTREVAVNLEQSTITQSDNNKWHLLRAKRITASKFGRVAKRVSRFETLVPQLNPSRRVVTADMQRGINMEPKAAMAYANNAKNGMVNLFPSGLIINPKCPWLGCTPDRKVYDIEAENNGSLPFGLLEVKVVKEGCTQFDDVAYLNKDPVTKELSLKKNHDYYYQVQCQIALSGLDWCDFFSFIDDNTFHCERIYFNKQFFQDSKDKIDQFYFDYYLK